MTEVRKWVVVDLDGTLCDCSHRVHLAQARQWDEFHSGIPEDKPNEDAVLFLKAVAAQDVSVLLCTGRNERHRTATGHWLTAQGLSELVDHLIMRPDDDRSSDHDLKPKLVYEFFGSKEIALSSVVLVLDDRDRVVNAWRDAGFKCWQVQQGSY